ncbi:MAG: TAXI family TRAP transporter solute-binding subunit, partial [Sciscionella sp.]
TGGTKGVYYQLGGALAAQWHSEYGIPTPAVLQTPGSVANLNLLRTGRVNVAFSAADAAADAVAQQKHSRGRQIRAIARIYDDYIHIVVRADSPIHRVADLHGRRVSIGSPNSGVELIAHRLLRVAGIDPGVDMRARHLGINDSLTALKAGKIDAFFWSGGLPTPGIAALAKQVPLRLVDIADLLPALQRRYPVYEPATVPASVYHLPGGPVTTLIVPNFLLVTVNMPDGVAKAITSTIFDRQRELVNANRAALSIDVHAAIETAPVPLHPGAAAYYRAQKP